MARSPLTHLRQARRGIISWVIAALLLPVLMGLVPQSALSAEAALDRAIAESLCGMAPPQSQQGQHNGQHQHCILCHVGAMHCAVALPAGGVSAAPDPQYFGSTPFVLTLVRHPDFALRRKGSPPTGPPASI